MPRVHRPALSIASLGLLVALLPAARAANPILTFEALTPVALKLQATQSATVKYLMTNQAVATKSFSMQPVAGVTQMDAAAGDCANPFTLAPGHTCVLNLQLDGAQMNDHAQGGPTVCDVSAPLDCYAPPMADQLDISIVLFADGFE